MKLPCVPLAFILVGIQFATFTVYGEDDPSTIIGFFKPGDCVGIKRGLPPYIINKYSKERFAITNDERVLKPSELAAKYPAVAAQIEEHWAELLRSRQENDVDNENLNHDRKILNVSINISDSTRLGKVVSVGKDYVLIAGSSPQKFKVAIAASKIASVNWVDEELPISIGLSSAAR